MDDIMLTIRMPRTLKERIELEAKKDNRSMTKYIVEVLKKDLADKEQR